MGEAESGRGWLAIAAPLVSWCGGRARLGMCKMIGDLVRVRSGLKQLGTGF